MTITELRAPASRYEPPAPPDLTDVAERRRLSPPAVRAMERLAAAMRLPTWFGGTWDSLADVLGDLSWQPAVGYLLLIEHAADLRDASPDDFDTLLEILNEAAFRWAEDDRPFWAILPMPTAALPDDAEE